MRWDRARILGRVPRWSAVGAAAAILLACGPTVEDAVPNQLQGRWITSEPKYQDRYFEIQPDRMIWGVGEFDLDAHPIEKIESQPQVAGKIRYWLHYTENEGYPNALEIELCLVPKAELRFVNRPEVWTRAPPR